MSIKGIEPGPMVQIIAVQIQLEYERAKAQRIQKPLAHAIRAVWELWDSVEVSEAEETK